MKKFWIRTVVPLVMLIMALGGCFEYRVEITDPNQNMLIPGDGHDAAFLPQASPDPQKNAPENGKTKKKTPPPPRANETIPKKNEPPLPPPVPSAVNNQTPENPTAVPVTNQDPGRLRRRGPWMWRAFTRLPQEEQQKLLNLQRTDPDRYREIMQARADELYAQEKAKREVIDALAARYHAATAVEEKQRLQAELRKLLKEDFQQRLIDTRGDIESYKRRTMQLETELQKREQNCEAIIDALLNSKLTQQD